MNTPHDPMWERVVDDHRPRRHELAAAEAELAAVNASDLAPEAITAMVARAVAAPTRADAGLPPRPRPLRLVVAGAMTLLFLTPLAWVGAQVVWPEQRASSLTLTYANAVRDAIAATRLADRASAVSIVDDHCLPAIRVLHQISADPSAPVAAAAQAARAELMRHLTGGADAAAPVAPAHADMLGASARAADAALPPAARVDAIAQLLRATTPGVTAIASARLEGVEAARRDVYVTRLGKYLR